MIDQRTKADLEKIAEHSPLVKLAMESENDSELILVLKRLLLLPVPLPVSFRR